MTSSNSKFVASRAKDKTAGQVPLGFIYLAANQSEMLPDVLEGTPAPKRLVAELRRVVDELKQVAERN
jgi:hypothetical protein